MTLLREARSLPPNTRKIPGMVMIGGFFWWVACIRVVVVAVLVVVKIN